MLVFWSVWLWEEVVSSQRALMASLLQTCPLKEEGYQHERDGYREFSMVVCRKIVQLNIMILSELYQSQKDKISYVFAHMLC